MSGTSTSRFRLTLVLAALVTCATVVVPGCSTDPSPDLRSDGDASSRAETDAGADPDAAAPPAPGSLRVNIVAPLRTAEDGTRATFTVALGSRPTLPVIVPVASSNESETKVEPSALTFTPEDWDQPKTVTLAGQNDDIADGDQQITITLGATSSADATYNGLRGEPIKATNADDDTVILPPRVLASSATTRNRCPARKRRK